jgi:hypothetical protein
VSASACPLTRMHIQVGHAVKCRSGTLQETRSCLRSRMAIFVRHHRGLSGYHDEVFDADHVVRTLTNVLVGAAGSHGYGAAQKDPFTFCHPRKRSCLHSEHALHCVSCLPLRCTKPDGRYVREWMTAPRSPCSATPHGQDETAWTAAG